MGRALNEGMKTPLAVLAATVAAATVLLAGCVAVPVEPAPAVYAPPPVVYAPAPRVVVQPYVYGHYYYRRAPYWRHGWR